MSKHTRELAAVRSLCALGLPAEQLIPALLEALHRVIPSSRNLFDWTDGDGNLVRYYFEGPIDHEVTRQYFEEFHNRREAEVMTAFRDAVTGRARVQSARELDSPAFYRSALYNEIWRPQGLHSRIEAIVRGLDGKPLGSIVLYRGLRERPFAAEDERLLAAVVPYVARALESSAALVPAAGLQRSGRRAVLSLSEAGVLQQLSRDAHKLLMLSHGGVTPECASRGPRAQDFPALAALVGQLRLRADSTRAATLTLDNAWGRFVYEAQALAPVVDAPAVIHVAIEHLESRELARRRVLAALPLSAAQSEVCALLLAGLTQPEIARRLGVEPSTVADHVRQIHLRLDVHSMHELGAGIDRLARSPT